MSAHTVTLPDSNVRVVAFKDGSVDFRARRGLLTLSPRDARALTAFLASPTEVEMDRAATKEGP